MVLSAEDQTYHSDFHKSCQELFAFRLVCHMSDRFTVRRVDALTGRPVHLYALRDVPVWRCERVSPHRLEATWYMGWVHIGLRGFLYYLGVVGLS